MWTGNGKQRTAPWVKLAWGGAAIGPNPTDRGKAGSKRSLLVEGDGGPLSLVVAGANVHDTKLLEGHPGGHCGSSGLSPLTRAPQHLCLDKGYDNPTGHQAAAAYGYQAHIRRIGEEKLDSSGEKTQSWPDVPLERTLSWLSKPKDYLSVTEKGILGSIEDPSCGLPVVLGGASLF